MQIPNPENKSYTLGQMIAPSGYTPPFVVEWSESQQQFHIAPLGEAMEKNRRIHAKGSGVDYIPLMICNTPEEAHQWAEIFREKRRTREVAESSQRVPKP